MVILRVALLCLATLAVPAAFGQSLRVTAVVNGTATTISDGSTLRVPTDGQESIITVSAQNVGGSNLTLSQIQVSGTDFILSTVPTLPLTLAPFSGTSFNIRYIPIAGRTTPAGQVVLQYTEQNQARAVSFGLVGATPDFSYFLVDANGTRGAISPGTTIPFAATRPASSTMLNLVVRNQGTAAGTIRGIAVLGRDFSTSIAPPVTVAAGQEVSIPIVFTPQTRGNSTGSVTLSTAVTSASFGLQGVGAAPDFVFAYALRSDGNTRPLTNNGRLTFSATAVASNAVAEVAIINQGNGPGEVRSVNVSGNSFQLVNTPLLPATLAAGEAFRFQIVFAPRQVGSYTGSLQIETEDRRLSAALEGTTLESSFQLLYLDPPSRSVIRINDQGTLNFAPTPIDAPVTYVVVAQNQGPGTGILNSVVVTGEGFQLVDLPSVPATLEAGKDLRFGIRFAPTQRTQYIGSLRVELATGALSATLTGSGTGPEFTFNVADADGTMTPVPTGSEITLRSQVAQTASRTIRITNTGNAPAQISAISVSGAGFQLANVPFLPTTLAVNDSQLFNVTFTPTQPGIVRGRLRVGDAGFDLTGTGLGPRAEYSYVNDAGRTAVAEGGTVILTPARVGESSRVEFALENTGTSALALSTIDAASQGNIFAVEGLPSLPVSVEPGGTIRFGVRFTPNNIGPASGALRLNNSTFALAASGRDPVPLPEYRISGASGVQQPLQQPAIALALDRPYSLPLRGAVTLSFFSDVFTENPGVQFSTGGRTVGFTIPANSTRAVFDSGSNEVKIQTGSVAGTLQLRANFATQAGLALPSSDSSALTLTLERSAVRLISGEIVNRTTNLFSIQVNGYSTTRTLRQLNIQLRPLGGEAFNPSSISLNVEPTAVAWFQTAQSQSLGGVFSITVPVNLRRGDTNADLTRYLQGVSVTVANEVGTSNSIDIPLQ